MCWIGRKFCFQSSVVGRSQLSAFVFCDRSLQSITLLTSAKTIGGFGHVVVTDLFDRDRLWAGASEQTV